ncbi:tetrahydrofolate synthase [Segatella salivae]|uniref:tetrahydrofolate synthase n=1 Tax=Segatella salivae TaxID=228604 RepID=UPI00352CDC60
MDIYVMMIVLTMQRHGCYVYLLMSVFVIMNISNSQHRMYYDDYSMNVFNIVTALMVQLGTSCSFDSPGLARNEPTPGKHSQGDSTP